MAHRLSLTLQRDDSAVLPLVGASQAMREIGRQVDLLAQGDHATALLIGESGTGKGRIAEYIHARSARSARPFVEINCATADSTMLAIELFGDGASTPGLLESVCGGTVFLDHVSDLDNDSQPRLLRALEEASAQVDSNQRQPARVIAAASKDMVNEVNAGRFREDLYYRLGITPVHLPPLRARSRDDLGELIAATFGALASSMCDSPHALGDGVIECLIAYPWPGNIRELRNALERAVMAARGNPVLQRVHLPAELQDLQDSGVVHMPRTLMDIERAHIHRTLHAHKLNRTHAARELGISRATLIKKIKEYGLVYDNPALP